MGINRECTVIEPKLPQSYLDDMYVLDLYIDSLIRQDPVLRSYKEMNEYEEETGSYETDYKDKK